MVRGPVYELEVRHDGLHKFRVIRGTDKYVLQQKAAAQMETWEEMWAKRQEIEEKKQEREAQLAEREEQKELAAALTDEATEAREGILRTLKCTLLVDDRVDWDKLKDSKPFAVPRPDKPQSLKLPDKPQPTDPCYVPSLSLLDRLFAKRREEKYLACKRAFIQHKKQWERECEARIEEHKRLLQEYASSLARWSQQKAEYEKEQELRNDAVERRKNAYLDGESEAVFEYCELVLSNSNYPSDFPQTFDILYQQESKLLIVDYGLPPIEEMPTLKEVKYIQSRDAMKKTHFVEKATNELYDSLLYQIALRTLHELYEADTIAALQSIVFNGYVTSVDKSTGQEVTACVLSVQASREEFLEINLDAVDPKACFKKLKGVGSAKLHRLAAVAPIVKFDKEDPRFVASYDVAGGLDDSVNIAAMDWQDFEHLIRELFEKEFSQGGADVKVTRASRDGGVDAVVFDPDPIRGGKIVIQAKRYTNVVGLSAVRDLYGTVVNEGAIKGILITTADYGPEAYEFARGKPLTLLNGSNLLHLLERHGHRARIDINEAKALLKDTEA